MNVLQCHMTNHMTCLPCQVILDDTKKWYSAHIQEVKPDKGPITVFVEDLGEK